jgi:AraC-like DNA-binding protein
MMEQTAPLINHEVREPDTFRSFPAFPSLSPAQLDNWLSAVSIHAISAMEWRWPKHWVIGSRTVNDSMFFWFKKGSGTAWFKNRSEVYHFKAGDMLLIPQDVEHEIEGSNAEEAHVYACHFFATLFGGIDLLSMLGFPIYLPSRPGSPFGKASERMARNAAVRAPGWAKLMECEIFSILIHIIRTETGRFTPLRSVDHQSDLPRLVPVLKWIEQNISEHDFTVADLARQVYLSETHFRRLFHEVFGTSPVQFIRQRRIERACSLLRSTTNPIKQIAADCGFAEEAFFSRVFHQALGTSPAAYRRAKLL